MSQRSVLDSRAEEERVEGSSLKERTTRGFAWLTFQAFASKGVGTLGQLVLTWLLAKGDFGLVSLCLSITAFGGLLRAGGLKEILIRRHAKFERWATSAFWLSMTLGVLAATAMIAAGPFLVLLFPNLGEQNQWRLYQLIVIAASTIPLEALSLVPMAKLQSELRFREIATLGLLANITNWGLQIGLAAAGFGPFAMVMPRPVVAIGTGLLFMWVGRVKLDWKPRVKRWRFMYRDTGLMTANAATNTMIMQGDNFILGHLYNQRIVGVYSWAFNMAAQTVFLFTSNLHGAMLPALAQMKDNKERQTGAYLRATLLTGVLGCFACVWQAGLARPVIHVMCHGNWDDTIPIFRIMSVNMAIVLACGPTSSLLLAQGRFVFQFWWGLFSAAIFLLVVWIGAVYGAGVGVAIAILIQTSVIVPLGCYLGIRPGGGRWSDVGRVAGLPLGISVLAVGLPMGVLKTGHLWAPGWNALMIKIGLPMAMLETSPWDQRNLLTFVVMLLVPPALYAGTIHRFFPAIWAESVGRVEALWGRLRGKGSGVVEVK